MKTTIKQIEGTTFAAISDSNHWSVLDTSVKDQGADGATGPMEMVLNALGSCSAIDVLLILKKMRVQVDDFEVNIEAERSDAHPKVFTRVHLEYVVKSSNLKASNLEKAIKLSIGTYCSVAGMVDKTAEITTSYKIVD